MYISVIARNDQVENKKTIKYSRETFLFQERCAFRSSNQSLGESEEVIMELKFLFICVIKVLIIQDITSIDHGHPLATKAINSILNEYFALNHPKVDLIVNGELIGETEKAVKKLLIEKPETIAVEVKQGGYVDPSNYQMNESSITIFNSFEIFNQSFKEIRWIKKSQMRFKHLVYVPNASASVILENIEDGFEVDNVNFLINETDKSIDLASVFMFTSESCHSKQLRVINRFKKDSMKWENSNFYPNKYKNLHNCCLPTERRRFHTAKHCQRVGKTSQFHYQPHKNWSSWSYFGIEVRSFSLF